MKQLIIIAVAAAGIFAGNVFGQVYKIDAAKSELIWHGQKIGLTNSGTVQIKEGQLIVDGEKFRGSFTIDMTSIVNTSLKSEKMRAKLVRHLKSEDFFSVAKHPTAAFEITKIVPYKADEGETANYRVTGNLTIKNITHEISFPAKIDFSDSGFAADAAFSIDRSKWDIRFHSGSFFENLGDNLIYDDIKFQLKLSGDKMDAVSSEAQ